MKHVIDLPVPPTLNTIWRRGAGRIYVSAAYLTWQKQADAHAMAQRLRVATIPGDFTAEIWIDRSKTRADLDNIGTKCLFDWAQSRRLIRNDKFCVGYSVEWVNAIDAPAGCRMTLYEAEK
jgi:Holliday junction resolvase RusA-like endonuclease